MKKNGEIVKCAHCGKEIYRKRCRLKKHNYCDAYCQMKYRYAHGLNGKEVTQMAHEVLRERGHYKRDNTYLCERNPAKNLEVRKKISESKFGEKNPMYHKYGENNPNYRGGISNIRRLLWGRCEYKEWRKNIFERDNFTCQICDDDKGGNLNAHHIKNFRDYPELRLDIDNGITLCKKCHIDIHKQLKNKELSFVYWILNKGDDRYNMPEKLMIKTYDATTKAIEGERAFEVTITTTAI